MANRRIALDDALDIAEQALPILETVLTELQKVERPTREDAKLAMQILTACTNAAACSRIYDAQLARQTPPTRISVDGLNAARREALAVDAEDEPVEPRRLGATRQ